MTTFIVGGRVTSPNGWLRLVRSQNHIPAFQSDWCSTADYRTRNSHDVRLGLDYTLGHDLASDTEPLFVQQASRICDLAQVQDS